MKRRALGALICAALIGAGGAGCKRSRAGTEQGANGREEPAPDGLSMRLTLAADGRSLGVEIRVKGPEAAEVKALRATRGWGGTRPLAAIQGVEVRDAGGPIAVGRAADEGAFSVLPLARPASGGEIVVRYTARADTEVSRLALHRGAGGLSGVGHGFVLRPALQHEMPLSVTLRAEPGSGAALATTLDGRKAATVEDLAAAVYVAGPLRSEVLASGDRATVAFGAAMDARAALDVAARTAGFAERVFGLDGRGERERVVLFVIGERGIGREHDGASTGGAVSVWIDAERTLDDGARILLSHEALHRVFGGALRLDAGGRDAAWFSEGFATHYARRALFDQGMITAEAFLADVARARDGGPEGATDGGAHALGYGLGSRYAALLDAEIRGRSGGKRSLDDVVRALAEIARKAPDEPIAMAVFRNTVTAEIGADRERALWDGLVIGALPELPDDAFGPCFRRKVEMRTVAALGFDAASLDASPQIIRGTVPGSAAERAGVRDGALVLRSSVRAGQRVDPDVEVELVLAGRKGKQVVRYRPARTEKVAAFAPQPCGR